MLCELADSSVVVVAHDVNLSIFRGPWFKRQAILTDEELSGEIVFAPSLVRIDTPEFDLLLLPDRVQFRPKTNVAAERSQDNLLRVLGGIVTTLPHTPFTAAGLNFGYIICPQDQEQFFDWHRTRLASPFAMAQTGSAEGSGARYGSYFSVAWGDMRLRADLKPVRLEDPAGNRLERVMAKFNYHADLQSDVSVNELLAIIGRWRTAGQHALAIAEALSA
jgi:hypothetical protein